jgi:hypothetical protein
MIAKVNAKVERDVRATGENGGGTGIRTKSMAYLISGQSGSAAKFLSTRTAEATLRARRQ